MPTAIKVRPAARLRVNSLIHRCSSNPPITPAAVTSAWPMQLPAATQTAAAIAAGAGAAAAIAAAVAAAAARAAVLYIPCGDNVNRNLKKEYKCVRGLWAYREKLPKRSVQQQGRRW
ncbi:uncharacterized protein EMH_0061860 [Eimeria mitis]|uniref:Uncharacterized protein n=1 Tax=Eimeria mitis TaxID=44415 RepID=U6JZG5_9EIME|nr:uncharacterized protein EMH_0061860 [Eimeria mitis]CDJ30860.1 hypothetical protein, conserved [Eimeria mitis]